MRSSMRMWRTLSNLTTGMRTSEIAFLISLLTSHIRAHIFSLFDGLFFTGLGLGPTVGGLIVRYTGSPLSVFYISSAFHLLLLAFIWLVIPESLTESQRAKARQQYEESIAKGKRDAIDTPVLYRFKRIFGFLSPLTVLWMAPEGAVGNPLKAKSGRGDWSLVLMAASSGFAMLLLVRLIQTNDEILKPTLSTRARIATSSSILQSCLAGPPKKSVPLVLCLRDARD